MRGYNTFKSLSSVIQKIIKDEVSFDFIIVSGDISQTSTKKSYQLFNSTLQQLEKPIYCIPGNHDDPALLNTFFPDSPINNVTSIEHASTLLIFVNTQIINQQYGQISKDNLIQISALLASKKHLQGIIVLHHPPVTVKSEWMDNIGLKNGPEFLQSINKYKNLKLILFGHVHQEIDTEFAHIRLFATPSTCYQFAPSEKTIQYDNQSPGYRLIKINTEGTIISQVSRI